MVEMMVAIAIFSIVMVTAMSALLNVINANNKARAVKTAINNISFALEGISKDVRMGTDYACGQNGAEPNGDCAGGGNVIRYRSIRSDKGADGLYRYAYYKIDSADGKIKECLSKGTVICSSSGPFQPITSHEVTIATSSKFYVLGRNCSVNSGLVCSAPDPTKKTQPRMILVISGEAGVKEKIKTTFDLQTSISERTRIRL